MQLMLHPRWMNDRHQVTLEDGEVLVFTKGQPVEILTEDQLRQVASRVGSALIIAKLEDHPSGVKYFRPDFESTERFVAGDPPAAESEPPAPRRRGRPRKQEVASDPA